jgi:beta-glucanase (GH16 family)
VTDNGDRPPLRRALTASAAFLVIVTILLAAADTAVPPAPVTAAQQASSVTPPVPVSPSVAATPSVGVSPPVPVTPPVSLTPPPNWKLAFSTDFPGTTLDTSTWDECYPWAASPQGCNNFGNRDEAEWYVPSQVHVENGALALVAQRTPTEGTDSSGQPKLYTCRSGMVTTYPSVYFKYGFVQVVARLPFGQGLWPAIWLVPENGSWPPEIDIVEHWGTELTSRATLHTTKQNKQQRGTVNFPDADQGWHTFTLYWTQSQISIYYDGELALTTTTRIPQLAMYLLLDLADDDTSPGSCSGTMYVKSVNIWEPS